MQFEIIIKNILGDVAKSAIFIKNKVDEETPHCLVYNDDVDGPTHMVERKQIERDHYNQYFNSSCFLPTVSIE